MKAVILCADKKEELFPFTETRPTGLLPVAGIEATGRLIRSLEVAGVDEIFIVANHLEEEYRSEYSDEEDINVVRQDEVDGTGNAVLECDFLDDDFFVLNGDVVVSEEDLVSLRKTHLNRQPEVSVLATGSDRPEKFGVLSITDDEIDAIEESPEQAENALINTGAYIFKPTIFDRIREVEGEKITDAFEPVIEDGKAIYELSDGYWMEIDSLRNFWRADRLKREEKVSGRVHQGADVSDGAELIGEVRVQEGAVVESGARIEGPTVIGENSVIGAGSVVRSSSIGDESQIRSATVEKSVLFEGNIVDPHVHVERSVLGEMVEVKAGSVVEESFIGPESLVNINNSVRGTKFVPGARTDLGEISK
ncbi:MAG: sugar phosphate nucleotidyltransferase [Candidatus Nanohaloarchaea archaeon]